MKKQSRFIAGAVGLLAVVAYLAVTGARSSMMYYYTPDELASRLVADPSARELGFKIAGRVVPGSVQYDARTLDLRFTLVGMDSGSASYPVYHNGPLPDTFQEGRDVVVEGRLGADGIFQATTVLTKCGSRYEAVEEDFRA